MHYVRRCPEPTLLRNIRKRYTQAWIDYYKNGIGNKPNDRKWNTFKDVLGNCFNGCCGYCEIRCRGEIDHYKPKSKFPKYVYVWTNWIYACHDCNHNKGKNWPRSGFIDPCCEKSFFNGKKSYFIFDLKTGEILIKPSLSKSDSNRAKQTVNYLKLNESYRLKIRLDHIQKLQDILILAKTNPNIAADRFVQLVSSNAPMVSLTTFFLEDQGLL